MFLYYLTSFVNGFMNSVNKMTNVKAVKCLGAAKGSLSNNLEATFLSPHGHIFALSAGLWRWS